jgi:signal transduction histidine kinase
LVCHLAGPVFVLGDANRLRQVFSNLLVNATKYTGAAGQITVSATTDHAEVRISVADTGCGIDPAIVPHIFELFVQEHAEAPGIGVGLNVVWEIVTKHGGRVEALSPGKDLGSEFVVRLPLSS